MSLVVCPCCAGEGLVDEVDDPPLTYMERKVFKAIMLIRLPHTNAETY